MKQECCKKIRLWGIIFLTSLFFAGCQAEDTSGEYEQETTQEDVQTEKSQSTDTGEIHNYTQSDIAMGTIVTSNIYTTGEDVNSEIFDVLKQVENTYISWREEDSEIARLNASAGNEQGVEISGKLEEMLQATLDISEKSSGALDPTLGKISRLWDIDGENPRVPAQEEITSLLKADGYKNVFCENQKAVLPADISIDLGAVGKGIGCDEVRSFLENHQEITGAVISVGGSILTYGAKENDSLWGVAITDPLSGGENYMGVLYLEGENYVSTSGDYEKYFEQDGVRYHHILDPKTGYPARSGLTSVTIVAENGLLSDGLSTACFVLGLEEGMKLVETYNAEAIFIDTDQNVYATDGLQDKFELTSKETYHLQELQQ